jgi:hypothetical protein
MSAIGRGLAILVWGRREAALRDPGRRRVSADQARKGVNTMNPTNKTRTAAHIVVGVAAAVLVPRITGKGVGAAIIGSIIAVYLHELLDAPVARVMVNAGLQL